MFGLVEAYYAGVLAAHAQHQAELDRIEKNRQTMAPEEFAEWKRNHDEVNQKRWESARDERRHRELVEAQKSSSDSTGAFALGVIFGSMF